MLIYFKVKLTGDLHSVKHDYWRNKQGEAAEQLSKVTNICVKKAVVKSEQTLCTYIL
jgi:hypothetical protein